MKHLLFTLLFFLLSNTAFAQNTSMGFEAYDTLSQEKKELIASLAEQFILEAVDSVMQEGMYMKALEMLDTLQDGWKKVFGKGPSPQVYIRKGQIYFSLEEWQQLVDVTAECINYNKDNMTDRVAALIYSMQGSGHRNLGNYNKAIRSYESAVGYYSKFGDNGSMGDMLCSIAYSYNKLGKTTAASSFYEKGIAKFLQYFNITRKQLLQSNLNVDEEYKKTVLGIFSAHLYCKAVSDNNNGDKLSYVEHLLMSANCGNTTAKREYLRYKAGLY